MGAGSPGNGNIEGIRLSKLTSPQKVNELRGKKCERVRRNECSKGKFATKKFVEKVMFRESLYEHKWFLKIEVFRFEGGNR